MTFLLMILVLAGLIYFGWRVSRMAANRPRTRTIGPDDDPEFLRRINPRDDQPRT